MITGTDAPQFTINRIFDAPRELVWRAWTEAEYAAAWWHPRGISVKPGSVRVGTRVGDTYAYTMVNDTTGEEYPTAGRYREFIPPERLVMTWGSPGDPDDDVPVLTIELREVDGGVRTEMFFHVLGIADRPGDKNVYDGWSEAFDVLAEQLSGLAGSGAS